MKKAKLFTSLAALALVLSLGACETKDVEITSSDETTTSEDTSTEDTTTEDDDENTGADDDDGDGDDDGNDDGGSTEDPNLALAQQILDVAASTQYLEWDALHAIEYEDDEKSAEIYLTLDTSSNAYGYWYQYDEDDDSETYNYYVDGIKYIYDPNEDEGEQYTTTDFGANIDLDTFLDDYSEALEDAEDIDLTDQGTTYALSEDGTTLEVEVTSTNYSGTELTTTYTYVINEDSEIVAVGLYAPDVVGLSYEGYYAELITYEAVVRAMATEFDITNWEEPTLKWSDYISETNYNKATDLLGTTLDGLVPVVLPSEGNYTSINVSGTRVTFELYDDSGRSTPKYDYETLTYAWEDAFASAGWSTSTSTKNLEYVIWSYELDNFLAVLQSYSEVSGVYNWDLHIYPSH